MKDKKVIFMGTPSFSVRVLEALIDNTNVIAVVTQPDKEVGRKKELTYSKVKECALEHNIKVLQPIKVRKEYQEIIDLKPDIIITCAYGQIIPNELLEYPKYGCINVHASLLPKLRGGAPIHHAIIDGYEETGITIMEMDDKMDHGAIITRESIVIEDSDTVGSLHDKLSALGADLLIKTLPSIFDKSYQKEEQDEDEVTFGYNITREDEFIDFNKPVREVFNRIRGLNPFPGAYAILDNEVVKLFDCEIGTLTCGKNGEIIKIYRDGIGISCNDREIIIKVIQFSGKKKMSVKDYLNGVSQDKLVGKIFNKN